jgi:O-antigen/teichoic acid export membrane protein
MSRLFVRRSATAVGIYSSVVLGVLASVVAAREFQSKLVFGDYSTVIFATGFFQTLFDLTVEESLVKYGFRYVTREDWGRLRRLFSTAFRFKAAGSLLGGGGMLVFAAFAPSRLATPLLIAAALPLAQSLEGLAASTFYLRSRYDIRSWFLVWSMGLRLSGVAVGAHFGLVQAIAGVLVAQLVATASIGLTGWIAFHRFPLTAARPLAEERRKILSFVAQSSVGTGVVSLRQFLAPLLLGAVTNTTQIGLFKVAQSPQQGFLALSAPARMVLLTEQTRDWEAGRQSAVLRGVRRYTALAALLMVIVVPPLYVYMPSLVRIVYGSTYAAAGGAARVFLLAAAVHFLVGWTKSFPVAVGRPNLRITTHGLESLVMLPAVVVLGSRYGATGAAVGVLASAIAFALDWAVVFLRTHAEDVQAPPPLYEAEAQEQGEAEAYAR